MKALRVGIPFYYGRLDTLGILPERQPLEAVLGEPLWPKGVSEASQKAVWESRLAANEPDRLTREKSESKKSATTKTTQPGGSFHLGRRVRREVAPEEVEEMHDRYIKAMGELFEKHKHKHPAYANATLEILSARG